MPKTSLYNMEGAAIGEVELSEELFAAPINTAAMHLVVRSILANQRQGTQSALTRGEVRGGGRKIYRQKGTGNARHHGNRAPQFTSRRRRVCAQAPRLSSSTCPRRSAAWPSRARMTSKLNAGEMIVVDEIKLAEAKTKRHGQGAGQLRPQEQDHARAARPRRDRRARRRQHRKASRLPTSTPSTCTIS